MQQNFPWYGKMLQCFTDSWYTNILDKNMFKFNKIKLEQMVIQPFYFPNFERIFTHWENILYQERCDPSSISVENIFDQSEN